MRDLPNYIKVDFYELWRSLLRYWWLFILLFIGAAAAGFLVSRSRTPVYQASARILVSQPTAFSGGGFTSSIPTASPLDSAAYREVAQSTQVLKSTLKNTGQKTDAATLEGFRKSIKFRTVDGISSSILVLSARNNNPAQAAKIANEWARALRQWEDLRVRGNFSRTRLTLEAQLRALDADTTNLTPDQAEARRAQRGNLLRDLETARAYEQYASGQLSSVEEAEPPSPDDPVAPRPVLTAILSGMLALALGFLALLLRTALARSIRNSEEAAQLTGLPVLGEFPRTAPSGKRELPREPASYLRTYVNRSLMDEHPKVIAITSPESGEGKSSTAITLAKAYARAGKRTLLIDLDLRKPVLHTEFNVASGSDIISTLRDPLFSMVPQKVEGGLYLLPCLQSMEDPAEILAEQFRPFLRRMLELQQWDVVVLDTAPVLEVTDTLIIAPHVSGLLVVVSANITNRRRLMASLDILKRIGAKVLGISVNNLRVGESITATARGYSTYGKLDPRDVRQTGEW